MGKEPLWLRTMATRVTRDSRVDNSRKFRTKLSKFHTRSHKCPISKRKCRTNSPRYPTNNRKCRTNCHRFQTRPNKCRTSNRKCRTNNHKFRINNRKCPTSSHRSPTKAAKMMAMPTTAPMTELLSHTADDRCPKPPQSFFKYDKNFTSLKSPFARGKET